MKIRNYKEGYKVSDCGIVFSKRGKPLSPADNGRGYLILSLRFGGKNKTKAVHRVVAETFVPNPENLPEVNHINGDKRDNRAVNLEWCERGHNIKHAYDSDLRSAKGEANIRCKTNVAVVEKICELLEAGYMPAKVRDLGYDYGLVRSIRSRKNWSDISNKYSW